MVHTQGVTGSNPVTATIIRPVGQVVKTPPFHGGIMGSNPVRVTTIIADNAYALFAIFLFLKHIELKKTSTRAIMIKNTVYYFGIKDIAVMFFMLNIILYEQILSKELSDKIDETFEKRKWVYETTK